jgi:cation diffusion facilitator family transporter
VGENMDIQGKKTRIAALSVASNSILVVIKLIVGLMIGSVAVFSEAIHSAMDLIAALIAFFAVRIAGKAADEDHQFGHTKVENISAAIEALLIFIAAAWIIYEAVQKLLNPHPIETVGWGVGVMLVSTIINFIVSRQLFKVGYETDSAALIADGWHLRTDVYTSLGVMVGLGIIWLCGFFLPDINIGWIDPVIAIIVALLIIHTSYNLTRHAVQDLVDKGLPEQERKWMEEYLSSLYPTVRSFHRLRTRKAGAIRFINLHLALDSNLTVSESHSIGDNVVAYLKQHFPQNIDPHHIDVIVHIEPCDGSCRPACKSGCLLNEEERKIIIARNSEPSSS